MICWTWYQNDKKPSRSFSNSFNVMTLLGVVCIAALTISLILRGTMWELSVQYKSQQAIQSFTRDLNEKEQKYKKFESLLHTCIEY